MPCNTMMGDDGVRWVHAMPVSVSVSGTFSGSKGSKTLRRIRSANAFTRGVPARFSVQLNLKLPDLIQNKTLDCEVRSLDEHLSMT